MRGLPAHYINLWRSRRKLSRSLAALDVKSRSQSPNMNAADIWKPLNNILVDQTNLVGILAGETNRCGLRGHRLSRPARRSTSLGSRFCRAGGVATSRARQNVFSREAIRSG